MSDEIYTADDVQRKVTADEKIEALKKFISYIFDTFTEDNIEERAVRSVARRIQKIIADDEVEADEG